MNTRNMKMLVALAAGFAATGLTAAEPEQELVQEAGRGRWTLTVGPSWRSQVKLETRGRVVAPPTTPRETILHEGYDMQDPANWNEGNTELRPNPQFPDWDTQHPRLWGVAGNRTEVYGVPGSDYVLSRSDEESPIGLNLQACYDALRGENWSLGVNARFAGYWNMKSSSSGFFHAGGTYKQYYRDWSLFDAIPSGTTFADFRNDVDPNLGDLPSINGGSDMTDSYKDKGSHAVTTRLRGDLYQIGLGPKVTWSPFKGRCECLSWLDLYAGAEVLCNISHARLEADGDSASETACLLGFGGNAGFVGNITDWLGVFGQVGYEWVDKTDVQVKGFNGEIDYSSLVLSAGVQFRF